MAEALIWIVVVCLVVAVVGHGLWLAAAWMLRQLSSSPSPPAERPRRECPRCSLPGLLPQGSCASCGYPLPLKFTGPLDGLEKLEDIIGRLQAAGQLDSDAAERLCEAVSAERQRAAALLAAQAIQPSSEPTEESTAAPTADAADFALPEPTTPTSLVVPAAPAAASEVAGSPLEVGARARQYAERRAADRGVAPVVPAAKKPRRPLAEVLSAFLEERHIRWGELVGGLLIVCCSIALVISFWSQIAERPFLKFFVFNGVTAAIFAAAWYTDRRWKLPNTSGGLFVIATLLVPLNFLAIAAFGRGDDAAGGWPVAGELFSIALFAALLLLAARSIAAEFPLLLVAGVMLSSVATLAVRRFIEPQSSLAWIYGVASLPLASAVTVTGGVLLRARRWTALGPEQAHGVFKLAGAAAFAVALALGLLVSRLSPLAEQLPRLSPLVAALGGCPLALGLLFWRRATDPGAAWIRVVGTSIAVLGALVMLSSLALAWPQPAYLVVVASLDALVLTAVAWRFALPAAHAVAGACFAVALLVVFHVVAGRLSWHAGAADVLRALVSAASGRALVGVAAVWAALAAASARASRLLDALFLAVVAGAAALASMVLVIWFGWGISGDPEGVAWVLGLYAVAALAVAWVFDSRESVVAGGGLLLGALWQLLAFALTDEWAPAQPGWAALLATSGTLAIIAALAERLGSAARTRFPAAARALAIALSLAAAVWIGALVLQEPAGRLAIHAYVLAGLWLLLAWDTAARVLFSAGQFVLVAAVVLSVAARLEAYGWFASSPRRWLDAWTWQAVGLALAALSLAWTALRLVVQRWSAAPSPRDWATRLSRLLAAPWPAVDRATVVLLVLLVLALGTRGALPGAAQELAPRSLAVQLATAAGEAVEPTGRVVPPIEAFQWFGTPHEHALGWGSWALLGAVLVVLAVGQWRGLERWPVLGGGATLFAACPLLAGFVEPDVAVASALRWLTADFLCIASLVIWQTRRGWVERWLDGSATLPAAALRRDAWLLIVLLALLPVAAFAAFVGGIAVAHRPPEAAVVNAYYWLAALGGASIVAALALRLALPTTKDWAGGLAMLLVVLGVGPLAAITMYIVGAALQGNGIVGPEPGSLFARIGLATSYAGPTCIVAATLIGHAFVERSSRFALAGGLFLNLSATAAYLLGVAPQGGLAFDARLWVLLAQLNAAVAAGYALAWIGTLVAARRRWDPRRPAVDGLLGVQAGLGAVLSALVLVPSAVALWLDPRLPSTAHEQAGSAGGWASTLISLAALVAAGWLTMGPRRPSEIASARTQIGIAAPALWAVGALVAFSLCTPGVADWRGYHALLIAQLVVGALVLAASWLLTRADLGSARLTRAASRWVTGLSAIAMACALRLSNEPLAPHAPWGCVLGLAATAVLLAALAGFAARRRFLYIALALVNVATLVWWTSPANPRVGLAGSAVGVLELLLALAIAFAVPAPAWLAIDLRLIRPHDGERRRQPAPGAHRPAAVLGLAVLAFAVLNGLAADAGGQPIEPHAAYRLGALAAGLAAVAACLWDVRAKLAVFGLYCWGVVGCAWLIDWWNLAPHRQLFAFAMIWAAYAVATSYLWATRVGLAEIAAALGIPREARAPQAGHTWVLGANSLLAAFVLAAGVWIVLTYAEIAFRQAAAQAMLAQGLSIGMLARGQRRSQLQAAALLIAVAGAAAWACAWLEPGGSGTPLNYLVAATVALALTAVIYGFALVKFFPRLGEWNRAAERLVPGLVAVGAASVAAILTVEVAYFASQSQVPIAWPGIVAVAAMLLGLVGAALAAALVPGRDPLALSERGRTAYVYAAEGLLALLLLHVRVTMPWLFAGWLVRYWPLVAMLIAFVGVGLAELFRRQQRAVLAEPLERTGALLPMLPVMGFWLMPSNVDYSLLLVAVGMLYAGLAVMRRSFGFGVLAGLAANGALWYFLHAVEGYRLWEHPQIWLIPPAACVLIATYLNRGRLSDAQMTELRYLSSMTIYVSSTADVFINGVAQAPWLPAVLAGLSIGGVFLGILLRVRAFLYLGASFLVVALFTVIWHAAYELEQTWIWYACGVAAGALIIALFGLFEKKRAEVLRLVEQLRTWDA